MLANIKLDISMDVHISRLPTSSVQFPCSGIAKTKLAILAFLYCGEFVKNHSILKVFIENRCCRMYQWSIVGLIAIIAQQKTNWDNVDLLCPEIGPVDFFPNSHLFR